MAGGFGFGGWHMGCGGLITVGILSLIFHTNLFTLLSPQPGTQTVRTPPDYAQDQREQPEVEFVSFVLDDVQKNWTRILPESRNVPYRHAKLVLFRNAYPSACGLAQAYVIAHELGHHVRDPLGSLPKVHRLQQARPDKANPLSVRLELQADCYAGIWGHTTAQRRIVNQSDVETALNAAAAVGDDRLQRIASGRVSPETFTQGTSAQRVRWFERGFQSGDLSACNTFSNV